MPAKCQRLLTYDGKKKLGYIFTDGCVPLIQQTPVNASLRGSLESVFLVDWNALTEEQQDAVIHYMMDKFDEGIPDQIRMEISDKGHFPIRDKYIIESYDMRYLM